MHEPETNLLVSQQEFTAPSLNQPEKASRALGRWATRGAAEPERAPEQFALLALACHIVVRLRLRSTRDADFWKMISLHGRVEESI